MVARTFLKTVAAQDMAEQAKWMLIYVFRNEEQHWVSRKEYDKAINVALELVKIDKENKDQHMKRIEYYRKLK